MLCSRLIVLICTFEFLHAFEVPVPTIEAFNTGGFRVSIPAVPGISEFRFQGNVNEKIGLLRPGTTELETHEERNGKWTLENTQQKLRVGDVINYWIFVKKDRLGYVKHAEPHRVTELVPYYEKTLVIVPPAPTYRPSLPPIAIHVPSTTTGTNWISSTENEVGADLNNCLNATMAFADLQGQVESLSKTVNLLVGILDKVPDTKRLMLSGVIPQDLSPMGTLRFVLWEKLDLRPSVTLAYRNKDGSVTFEVETLMEKIEILKVAENKLMHSRIVIS